MQRRNFIKNTAGWGVLMLPALRSFRQLINAPSINNAKLTGPTQPVFIYNNWSAYDELSDNVAQTETLAMQELNEIIRLKRNGIKIDYYVMDAFWFDKDGGYRTWHKQHWPNGPDKWLAACKENDIRPGMWFSTNLISGGGNVFLNLIDEWKDSVGDDKGILCMFEGGYLSHLSETLQIWYNKDVRLFKFDFAYFDAATVDAKKKYTKEEIIEKNKTAFMKMLQHFREKNPDVLITGYNGFGGDMENTFTPFDKKIDPRWLDTFDSLYCGDPRFSDVPMMNIWRSQDNYSDHQVFAFQAYGLPINRIDNCAFMIGKTGTCYKRGTHCWKGMLILELARGGWVNVYHGNLELLNGEDAKWFALAQSIFHPLQQQNQISSFGEIPGTGKPYGFKAMGTNGSVYTIVNPSQQVISVQLPFNSNSQAKIIYEDGGFKPFIKDGEITLGAEQLVVIGVGEYAKEQYNLGVDESIHIPNSINEIKANFSKPGKNEIKGQVKASPHKNIRIVLQQYDAHGLPRRSWGGAPPKGKKISEFIKIIVTQDGKQVSNHIENDKMIWSGLSWAVAEINAKEIDFKKPLNIRGISTETDEVHLKAKVYEVEY